MMKRATIWAATAVAFLALTAFASVGYLNAQETPNDSAPTLEQPPGGFQPRPGGLQPGGPGPQPGQPGLPGRAPGGPGFNAPQPMMGQMGGGPAQMAVSGNNLYILRGNKIHRLNATTLKIEATETLPDDRPMPPRGEIE